MNIRRFTAPATDSLAFRRIADPWSVGRAKIFSEPLLAYCANLVRSLILTDAAGCQARTLASEWEEQDVEDASGSAFAGEPSRFPARRHGRCRGADDRAPARRRPVADHSAERSHHARLHRRRQDGWRPRSRLPQDAGRPDPRHLRRPSGNPRTRPGRGQSAVWRFEMRRPSRFPRAAGAARHRRGRHRAPENAGIR